MLGGQRGNHRHFVTGGGLELFHSCLVPVLLIGTTLLNKKFSFQIFSIISVLLGDFLNQLPSRTQNHLTLATRQSLLLPS